MLLPSEKLAFLTFLHFLLQKLRIIAVRAFVLITVFLLSVVAHAQSEKDQFYMQQCSKWHFNKDSLQHYGKLLIQSENEKAIAEGYYALGYAQQKDMANDSALFYYDKADLLAKQINDYRFRSRIIKNQAVAAGKAGNVELAFRFLDLLEQLGVDHQDSLLIGLSYNQRGIYYKELGRLEEAAKVHTEGARLYQQLNNANVINSYTNLALVYVELGADSLAHYYFHKAYKVAQEKQIDRLHFRATGNLGNFHRVAGNSDSALHYFSIQLRDTAKIPLQAKMILYQNLAELSIENGILERASILLKKLEKELQGKKSTKRFIEFYNVSMRYEMALENWEQALAFADSSLALNKEQGYASKTLPVLQSRAFLLEKLDRYDEALASLKEYATVKDSMVAATNVEAIEKVAAKFQLDEKEKELRKALLAKETTSDYLNVALFTILGILFLAGAVLFQFRKPKKSSKKKELIQPEEPAQKVKLYPKLFIQLNSGAKVLKDEIVYIKSEGHYLNYFFSNEVRPELDRDTMMSRAEELSSKGFIRVHRSYLVNEQHVVKVKNAQVLMSNRDQVPLSKTYREQLIAQKHPLFI